MLFDKQLKLEQSLSEILMLYACSVVNRKPVVSTPDLTSNLTAGVRKKLISFTCRRSHSSGARLPPGCGAVSAASALLLLSGTVAIFPLDIQPLPCGL